MISNCLMCVIFTHYKQSVRHVVVVGFLPVVDGARGVLLLDDVGDNFGLEHLVDEIAGLRVSPVPFFAVLFGLGHHVFHLLVEAQQLHIDAIQGLLPVNQRNQYGVDDDAEEDDGKDDVSHELGHFLIGDED